MPQDDLFRPAIERTRPMAAIRAARFLAEDAGVALAAQGFASR